jgi:hypothetical protein
MAGRSEGRVGNEAILSVTSLLRRADIMQA